MALTKTVTKIFPKDLKNGTYQVGMHLKLEDENITVIDEDFTEGFAKGQQVTNEAKIRMGSRMQEAIDSYKATKNMYDSSAYETARAQIDAGLTL